MSRLPSGTQDILSDSVFPCPGAVGWFREMDPVAFPAREALGPQIALRICLGAARSSRNLGDQPQEHCQQQ